MSLVSSNSSVPAVSNGVVVHGPIVPSLTSVATIVVSAISAVVSILTLGFRFYAQRYSKHGIIAEDYPFVVALVLLVSMDVLAIWSSMMAGIGWPLVRILEGGLEMLQRMGVVIFVGLLLWGASLVFIRAGLLLFYRRIFPGQTCHRVINVFLVINFTWLCTLFIGMFAKFRWTSTVTTSYGYAMWLLVHSILDVVLDLTTLCIPLFVIKSLNMQRRSKILVGGLFILGFFCIVASCIRLKYMVDVLHDRSNPTRPRYLYSIYQICIWGIIHPTVALFTSCLPAYVPAFQRNKRLNKIMKKAVSLVPVRENAEGKENLARMRCESQISKTIVWSVQHNASDEDFPEHLARTQSHTVTPFV